MTDGSTDEPTGSLNQYGDDIVRTTGRHGADISSQRLDDLDRAALRHALDTLDRCPTAVDIGCGLGAQGARFGLMGVETTLMDVLDISARIEFLEEAFDICELTFLNIDSRTVAPDDLPERIGTVYSQRFIHYLVFDDAVDLFRTVVDRLDDQGRVFVSASGLHTELGTGYPHADRPLEDRFAKLAPEMQEKHDIRERICLYTVADMEQLLRTVGVEPVQVVRSEFGNVKAIGEPE